MAILGILAGLVAGAVGGTSTTGQTARFDVDANTIGTAADRFFMEAFPQSYPSSTPSQLQVAGISGVAVVNFDAPLPQDPSRTFVDDYLKTVPKSAVIVSWRIDIENGMVFFAREGAPLVRASQARVEVKANATTTPGVTSKYDITFTMKKNQATTLIFEVEIPIGYTVNGTPASSVQTIGTMVGSIETDNPWVYGQPISFSGTLRTSGTDNKWQLSVDYPNSMKPVSTGGLAPTVTGRNSAVHDIAVVPTGNDRPGKLILRFNRTGEPAGLEHYLATEKWVLTIGNNSFPNIITNPVHPDVYRWTTIQVTTIAPVGVFEEVAGNQAVIIK